jgi:hypothetical protein
MITSGTRLGPYEVVAPLEAASSAKRTISQLNHPHICTLYDVGVAAGVSPAGPAGTPAPTQEMPRNSKNGITIERHQAA